MAAAFTHATRPELIATEFVHVLSSADCVYSARATVQSTKDTEEIISAVASEECDQQMSEHRLSIGFRGSREIQLHVRPRPGVDSVATINAVTLLLNSLCQMR